MAKKIKGPQIVSAHRLADGYAVFFTKSFEWSENIDDSALAEDAESLDALLKATEKSVAQQIVVEPYSLAVELQEGHLRPTHYRERIRAVGPSILPRFHRNPAFYKSADDLRSIGDQG